MATVAGVDLLFYIVDNAGLFDVCSIEKYGCFKCSNGLLRFSMQLPYYHLFIHIQSDTSIHVKSNFAVVRIGCNIGHIYITFIVTYDFDT